MIDRQGVFGRLLAFLLAAASTLPAHAANYSDIWWNPSESGWGLTIADHSTDLFAVWYAYRADGKGAWFVIPGGSLSQDRRFFTGDMYQTTGPSFISNPFDPTLVESTKVGTASIDFAPPALTPGSAIFTYSVGSVRGAKQIERQSFGDAPANWGNDLTDIWWNPTQSGWGLSLAQHGNVLFGVWFTYGLDGQPIFVVLPSGTANGANGYSGDLYVTTGPYFGNEAFDPARVVPTKVGTATIAIDQTKAFPPNVTYSATVLGVSVIERITHQGFGTPPPGFCKVALSPTIQVAPSSGGVFSVNVDAPTGCPWAADTSTPLKQWITILSGSVGNGPGQIVYSVDSNDLPAQRSDWITVTGALQVLVVTQNAAVAETGDTYAGTFDGTGVFSIYMQDGSLAACSARYHGSMSVTYTVQNDGVTYLGSARITGTFDTQPCGSLPPQSFQWATSDNVSGRLPAFSWTTVVVSGESAGVVNASLSTPLDAIVGEIAFTISDTAGVANAPFTLTRQP